ncbi:MAG: trehalose-phosphatase [Ilumatobacter sp.]|uniref:trehalose-phosphatase n=1 Tax=Ilumatobacter sp. TaxID=1967498 RepID=UPI00391C5907
MSEHAVDDPAELAAILAQLPSPILLVFDCDGVLAPLVDHADDSVLTPGVAERLVSLAAARPGDVRVAVLSGRSLDGLAQFAFDESIIVVGSYGGERRDREPHPLDDDEAALLRLLDDEATRACQLAGPGAWVERKPASVVLHVRQADRDAGAKALADLAQRQRSIAGSQAHAGSDVLELMARPSNKGLALQQLCDDEAPASTVYLGDDLPDEDAFAVLGAGDIGIKIGLGETRAPHRLQDPTAVSVFLDRLLDRLLDRASEQ